MAELCRIIERSETTPSLEALAKHAGFSVFHLHRVFKAVTGVTPRAYAAAHRARRVAGELERSETVTEAIYSAGYSGTGRFYEESTARLGMTPTRYRAGGTLACLPVVLAAATLGRSPRRRA